VQLEVLGGSGAYNEWGTKCTRGNLVLELCSLYPKRRLQGTIKCQNEEEAVCRLLLHCSSQYLCLYELWSGAAVGYLYGVRSTSIYGVQ
jgi:hypothetical protein